MNKVIEAVKKDGTRQLVSNALMREYAQKASEICRQWKKNSGWVREFGNLLARMMYCRGYVALDEIRYDGDGNVKRIRLMVAA